MINEVQRRSYLQAMGVENYMPRRLLPGAAASRLIELPPALREALQPPEDVEGRGEAPPAAPDVSTASDDAPPVAPAAAGRASQSLRAMLDITAPSRAGDTAQRPAPQPAAKAAGRNSTQAVQFDLAVLCTEQGLLLIDDYPSADRQAYQLLVQNLLFALGLNPEAPRLEHFGWPKTRGRRPSASVDLGPDAARESLCAALHRRVERGAVRQVLLMGELAWQYGSELAVGDELQHSVLLGVPVLHTVSLSQALSAPELKAELWRQLQPLCGTQ